ncbi:glycosyltransferase family 2 protein [uncultured Draconibacterium sp.]|uniref:glycosyltransferase family 2 protein n=1 Tax=uncultured Draconibacterium sp. TaxID=1573823 RepID=UPI0032172B7C
MSAKITVITISYNCASDLEDTIKSVVNQTFKEIEYIVVDGGSKDDTGEVLKKYNCKISKWISEPDYGIYDAMNKGLKMATGDYIIFMNAGDTFFEDESLGKISFDKFPNADIFYGETLMISEEGKELGLRTKKLPHNLNWKHFKRGMVVCHQAFVMKRIKAPEYNLRYKLSADVEWVLKCLKESKQIIYTETILARFLEGGASKKRHSESLQERFQIMKTYFGLFSTILSHIVFIIENTWMLLGFKSKYRKSNL